jgi:hypothetical protein
MSGVGNSGSKAFDENAIENALPPVDLAPQETTEENNE